MEFEHLKLNEEYSVLQHTSDGLEYNIENNIPTSPTVLDILGIERKNEESYSELWFLESHISCTSEDNAKLLAGMLKEVFDKAFQMNLIYKGVPEED